MNPDELDPRVQDYEPPLYYIDHQEVEISAENVNDENEDDDDDEPLVPAPRQNAALMEIGSDYDADEDPDASDGAQCVVQNLPANDSDDIDVASTCTICYSSYTNSGEHRLCCLKCGHLFGKSCIIHWLKTACPSTGRKCPTCNLKATTRDIRVLYAKTLIAWDTTEKDRLLQQLQKMELEKNKLDSLLKHSTSKIHNLQDQIKELESQIRNLSENPRFSEQTKTGNSSIRMKVISNFKLSEKGCRVLASSAHLSLLLASQESPNQLFPGFGIRKINTVDMKPAPYQNNLHKKEIRDMAFSYHDRGSLLSVSLDCTAKIFDVQSNVAVQALSVPEPLWSCCWSSLDSNKFFCGGQKSTVFMFDRRFLSGEPAKIIQLPDSKTGILSLCEIPPRAGRFMSNGGILACRLTSLTAVHSSYDELDCTILPVEGNFLSMRYNNSTDSVLISARPSKNFAAPRHIVGRLSKSIFGEPKSGVIDVIHTFYGARSPKVLSRSALVPFGNNDQVVCAYNERDKTLDAWSLMADMKLNSEDIRLPESVLDICSFHTYNEDVFVPCLSESSLSVVKFSSLN